MPVKLFLLGSLVTLLLAGCPRTDHIAPGPDVIDVPDSDLCGKMCKHIGPEGLKCEEGEPVYDSDKPGPVGVPNTSCEEFCKMSQALGMPLNPRCVSLAPTCDAIEDFRVKNPETCGG